MLNKRKKSWMVTEQKRIHQAATTKCRGPGNLQRHQLKLTSNNSSRLKLPSRPELNFYQQRNVITHQLTVLSPFQISSSTRIVEME